MFKLNDIIDTNKLAVNWDCVWCIPEFNILQNTHQNPKWHLEDYVSTHTYSVTENMCKLLYGESDKHKCLYMIAAALFHDIGKAITTKWDEDKNTWVSPRHAIASEQITRRLLWDEPFELREKICSLVRNHMKPLYIYEKENHIKEIAKLAEDCNFTELLLLKKADCLGAKTAVEDNWQEKLDKAYSDAQIASCINGFTFKNDFMRYMYFNAENEHINPNDNNYGDFTVYVMIGLPGAGKDTYVKEHLSNLPVVSRDIIRTSIGIEGEKPMGNKEQEEKVTKIQDKLIRKYSENKQSFVINNTNLRLKYREGYKRLFNKYRPRVVYIYVEAPTFEDNLKRRAGTVPPYVIEKMRDNFEFPKKYEAYEILIWKQR